MLALFKVLPPIRPGRDCVRGSPSAMNRRALPENRTLRCGWVPDRGVRVLLSLGLLLAGGLGGLAQTKNMNDSTNHLEVATLGGGCFWCTEAIFQMLPGVKSVTSGYAGGTKENPTYKEVCTGNTGHADAKPSSSVPRQVAFLTRNCSTPCSSPRFFWTVSSISGTNI